jgi:hypothetical protein
MSTAVVQLAAVGCSIKLSVEKEQEEEGLALIALLYFSVGSSVQSPRAM